MDSLDLLVLSSLGGGVLAFVIYRYLSSSSSASASSHLNGNGSNGSTLSGRSSPRLSLSPRGSLSPRPMSPRSPRNGRFKFSEDDRDFVTKMQAAQSTIVIFFGSQTGTAEDYAGRLAGEARRYGLKALVCDIQDYDMEQLGKLKSSIPNACAVFTVATYGEGEPTDNMQEFYNQLKMLGGKTEQQLAEDEDNCKWQLKGLKYAVFGLGNKTYEHFNAMGILVDEVLKELGGERLLPVGLGDDDENLEEDFVNWKDEMWPLVCEVNGKDPHALGAAFRTYQMDLVETLDVEKVFVGEQAILKSYVRQKKPFTVKNPYLASVSIRQELYQDPQRSCIHLELDIADSGLRYSAGDHVAVFAENNANLVDRLGKRLKIDLDRVFTMKATDSFAKKKSPFPTPCSFRTAFTYYVDITSPASLNIMGEMVPYAQDPAEKVRLETLVAKNKRDEYNNYVIEGCRSALVILEEFPSVNMPVDHLLELLPFLQPRYYSISSSFTAYPKSVHITAAVVAYNAPSGFQVEGVATSFMSRLDLVNKKIPIYIRSSQFRLPTNAKLPVIMIGPGTGLAPFRGFIQERVAQKTGGKEVGEMVLFFGCQKQQQHFMYREELENYVNQGVLTRLFTAFSRDQTDKIYVQHRLLEQKQLVWELLEKGAYVYICGDAKHMARDVNGTLQTIIQAMGGKTEKQAEDFVKMLGQKRRLQQDVWS